MSDSVILETSLGNIQLKLYWDHAPRLIVHLTFGIAMSFGHARISPISRRGVLQRR
ncbi:hypothetical protein FB451DRAFT_486501 [Mycena latifolia]|nr:hypothetical protein FB451DRAFT_486501 [Mycena latifolia]